jgi:Tfp pilus assembly protein PilW
VKISNYERGQSMFELVVAIAISALVIVTIVSLTTISIRNSNFSKNKSLASTYAQQATEY